MDGRKKRVAGTFMFDYFRFVVLNIVIIQEMTASHSIGAISASLDRNRATHSLRGAFPSAWSENSTVAH